MRTNIDDDDDDNRTTIINDNEEAKAEVRDRRSRRQRGLRCGVCSTCFHCACVCVTQHIVVVIVGCHSLYNQISCFVNSKCRYVLHDETHKARLARLRRNYCCHRVSLAKENFSLLPLNLSLSLSLSHFYKYMSYTCNVNNIAALNESI